MVDLQVDVVYSSFLKNEVNIKTPSDVAVVLEKVGSETFLCTVHLNK